MTSKYRVAATAFVFLLSCGVALADGHGRGHDKHRDHDDDDRGHYVYTDHDRGEMREWYHAHYRHLPPGLAKRDQLPPGLERRLVVREMLPVELRERVRPCPEDFVRELPPPPPDCEHVLIGGHVVLLNRRTFNVLAVFHFEF
jgi:hypothetical protein